MYRRIAIGLMLFLLGSVSVMAEVLKPADVFGFEPGADYKQMLDYYQRLDKESDRVQLKEIGFAFRPQFRGQPRGTYKLLFNALQGTAVDTNSRRTDASR